MFCRKSESRYLFVIFVELECWHAFHITVRGHILEEMKKRLLPSVWHGAWAESFAPQNSFPFCYSRAAKCSIGVLQRWKEKKTLYQNESYLVDIFLLSIFQVKKSETSSSEIRNLVTSRYSHFEEFFPGNKLYWFIKI